MDHLLKHLSESLHQARSQEELVRPLLEMLGQVTQLESTYLTTIDFAQDLQHVLYARNTQQMQIPEGLSVPWNDTLCQRALAEGRTCTSNVQECWGDSQAARALGIRTYVSAAVRMSDGSIYGTLCAASARAATLPDSTEIVLQLFAKLIAQHVEREKLMQALQQRNEQLTRLALTDALTQLPNRAAVRDALHRLLARAQRSGDSVLVAFIDLDGFKCVNDKHGHAAGDRLLCAVAQGLQAVLRGACTRPINHARGPESAAAQSFQMHGASAKWQLSALSRCQHWYCASAWSDDGGRSAAAGRPGHVCRQKTAARTGHCPTAWPAHVKQAVACWAWPSSALRLQTQPASPPAQTGLLSVAAA